MSKLLNRLEKTRLVGVSPFGPSTYQPSIPRVTLGIAGAAMAVITITLSVILPAQMDSRSREPRVFAPSKETAPASMGLAAITSVEVVAVREPASSAIPVRIGEAAPKSGRLGKTTSPTAVRVSSTGQ